MISNENKVGAQLKNGNSLNYSDSKRWRDIIIVALEDLENSDNNSFDELIMNIVSDKRLSALTGGVRENMPFERSELESPSFPGMTNREKNERLISHKKKEQITSEFWNSEFEILRSNVQDEYNQLKNKIINGQVRVKPKALVKTTKSSRMSKMIHTLSTCFNSNKSSVLPATEDNLPVADKIPYAHAEYITKKLKQYKKQALLASKESKVDAVFSSPSLDLALSSNKKFKVSR